MSGSVLLPWKPHKHLVSIETEHQTLCIMKLMRHFKNIDFGFFTITKKRRKYLRLKNNEIVPSAFHLFLLKKHCSHAQESYASTNSQVHTLRRIVREKDQTIRRQSRLERQAQEAQQAGGPGAPQPTRGEGDGGVGDSASPSPPLCPNLSPR